MGVEQVEERAPTAQADACLDKVEFSLAELPPLPVDLPSFAASLVKLGVVRSVPRLQGRTNVRLDVDATVRGLPFEGHVQLKGTLNLNALPSGGVQLLPTSAITFNMMRALRTQIDAPPPQAFAGDNFIGPYSGQWPRLLDLQLVDARMAVDWLLSRLAQAAGTSELPAGRFRLKWCEVCRDRRVDDARSLARRFGSEFSGGVARRSRVYNLATEQSGNLTAVSWDDGTKAGKIVRKVYAKAPDLLRTEVALREAKAVARLLGRNQAGAADVILAGTAVADLLGRVAVAAQPVLDEIWLASEGVEAPPADRFQFLLGLAPLLRVASPPGRAEGGRPTASDTVALARQALGVLLDLGRFNAQGIRGTNSLRKALDEMAGGDRPVLERQGPRGTLFVVRKEYAAARQALASALLADATAPGLLNQKEKPGAA